MKGLAAALGATIALLATARPGPAAAATRVDPPSAEVRAVAGTMSAAQIRARLAFLADDLFEGRGTGTRGHELAARYVAAELEALGLAAAGTDGFLQPVPLRQAELLLPSRRLTLVRGAREEDLVPDVDYGMLADALRTQADVSAPVVYVGYGVVAPDLGHDDYAEVDVRGRVVAVLSGAPSGFPPTLRAHHGSWTAKAQTAADHGAVGMLTLRGKADERRGKWEASAAYLRRPVMRWLDENGRPHDVPESLLASAALSPQGMEKLFAGASRGLAETLAATEAGRVGSFALSVTARMHKESRHQGLQSPNVAALLPGSDPRLAAETVVLSAHLDHLGVGEAVDGDAIYNGAWDNASGIATLIEVARAFTRLARPPRRSVLFLATTGEEKGLLGADYFAHHPTRPLDSLVADITIDTFMGLVPVKDVAALGGEHSSLGAVAEAAARAVGLEVGADPFPEQSFFVRSDQYAFVKQGVPSLFPVSGTTSGVSGVDAAAVQREWMKTRYHSPRDDAGQAFDWPSMLKGAQFCFVAADLVAEAPARPAWNPGDVFGRLFGRR